MSTIFSPELQLVLALSHPEGLQTSKINSLLENSLDWNRLIEISHRQHVSAIIYTRLQREPHFLPTNVLHTFNSYSSKITARNLFLLAAFEQIINEGKKVGLNFVAFKGIDNIQRIYPNIKERFLSDIDIMIESNKLNSARELLNSLGYMCIENVRQSRFHEKKYGYIHAPLQCSKGGINIDLHTRLGTEKAKINELAWRHIQGDYYNHFTPAFNMLYHCFHLNKHTESHGFKLNQLTELAMMWNACSPADKTLFKQLSIQADGENWVNHSFDLLHYFYPSHIETEGDLTTVPNEFVRGNVLKWIEEGKKVKLNTLTHSLTIFESLAYYFFQIFPVKNYLIQWHGPQFSETSYIKLWIIRLLKIWTRLFKRK